MAELFHETRLTCASNLHYEVEIPSASKLGSYVCVYDKLPRGEPYAMGWQCSCPAFKFGPRNSHGLKHCKHTKQAEAHRCGYGWEAFCGDSPTAGPDGTCPRCRGPMRPVLVGV